MLKKDILDLIDNFEREIWKFDDNDKLYNDMHYIYSIEKEIKTSDESNIKPIYDKLIALIGMIRFKYGFESIIIKSNQELENLKEIIEGFSLNSNDIINQYNYISKNKNMDFIKNNYENKQGKEGLYLAIESLKSLITNDEYRKLLNKSQINNVIIDCVKLNNGIANIN